MLPGQMLLGQILLRKLTSAKVGARKLTLKFGQNQVRNNYDNVNMVKCHQDNCHMNKWQFDS